MKPEKNIYVFYEKADNNRSEEEKHGWVDYFRRFLKMMLRQILGREPSFLELSEEKVPGPEQLKNVEILILILSPQSLKSGKFAKVIEHFKAVHADTSQNRIFKVFKYPVNMADQPEELRKLLSYDLYDYNSQTGETREFANFFSHDAEINYWMKMVDLAYDINEALTIYDQGDQKESGTNKRHGIYLAETSPELVVQRNMVKRELQRMGYVIYPRQNLPEEGDETGQMIMEILKNCFVSIHLMGDRVDIEEDGAFANIVTFQNDTVSKYIIEKEDDDLGNFSRLIWLSPNFRVTEEKHHRFIEKLRREVEDTGRTEIFQTPFEDFKFILRRTLPELPDRAKEEESIETSGGRRKIYVIYDKKDKGNVGPLISLFGKKGYEVLKPEFEGDLMEIRRLHIQHLVDFDGVVIYFGEVNEFWVRMKLLDILKSPGFGRLKPLNHKAIVASGGKQISKDNFRTYEVEVIQADQINEKALDPFLMKMN